MKQTFKILVVLLLCVPTFIFAQNNGQNEKCGTEFTPEMEARLLQNIATAKALGLSNGANRTTTFVAVKFHLVANSDGSSRPSVSRVYDALCGLNSRYADQNIKFYLAGIYDMNSTTVFSHSSVSAAQFQMSVRKNQHPNAINIFVCNSVNTNNNSPGTTLAYYSPVYDLIATRSNQMNLTSKTLTHEMGHFLSLPHPFNGWEGYDYHCNLDTYTAADPCPNAIYGASNLPPTSVGGNLVELADRSNCSTSGDYFCDTEPDYNLGFLGGSNCNYSQGAVDPNGDVINPDETLYMSYFDDNCTNRFSNDQKAAIAADLLTSARNYIKGTPSSTIEITTPATLVAPTNNGTSPFWDEVFLDWDDVSGANKYFVQISRNSSFSLLVDEAIVTNSLYASTALSAGTNYFWRVKAYNEISVCNGYSATRQFSTSSFTTGTKEVLNTTAIKLQPNFTSEGQVINLNIQTQEKIEATIRIVNVAGQVVQAINNLTFQAGTHIHQIETTGLTPGVYIVNLQTDKGQVNEKLIITN